MAELREFEDLNYYLPPTWCPVPVGELDNDWEHMVAHRLCDGEDNREILAYRLAKTHPALIEDRHENIAVWVPDREIPQMAAVLVVDLLASEPGYPAEREHYRSLIDPDPRAWCTVYSRHIEDVDIAAGPALLVREVISYQDSPSDPESKMVEEHVIYTVFPTGCRDALQLMFWTPTLELGDALAEDAAVMTGSLEVTLR